MERRQATIGILLLSIGGYTLLKTSSIMKQNEDIIIAINFTSLTLIISSLLLLLLFVFRRIQHNKENKTDPVQEEDKYIKRAKRMVD
jgi:hypothetical protein